MRRTLQLVRHILQRFTLVLLCHLPLPRYTANTSEATIQRPFALTVSALVSPAALCVCQVLSASEMKTLLLSQQLLRKVTARCSCSLDTVAPAAYEALQWGAYKGKCKSLCFNLKNSESLVLSLLVGDATAVETIAANSGVSTVPYQYL